MNGPEPPQTPLAPFAISAAAVGADVALATLDAMIGLGFVKDEVKKLVARAVVEQRRRAEGRSPASLHVVLTGPSGVGKSALGHVLAQIYRGVGLLRQGQVVHAARSDLVDTFIGQTAAKTLRTCSDTLDGVLFIDDAYMMGRTDPSGPDFCHEAIDALATFMDDHRDRIIVIAAGATDEMLRFLDAQPGLAGRFATRIDIPAYDADELAAILRAMVHSHDDDLPKGIEAKLAPWIDAHARRPDWAHARAMRTLLNRARNARLRRLAHDPDGDQECLTLSDFDWAMRA